MSKPVCGSFRPRLWGDRRICGGCSHDRDDHPDFELRFHMNCDGKHKCDQCMLKLRPVCGRFREEKETGYCRNCDWREDFHRTYEPTWMQIVAGCLSDQPRNLATVYECVRIGFPERVRDCPSWRSKVRQSLWWLYQHDKSTAISDPRFEAWVWRQDWKILTGI